MSEFEEGILRSLRRLTRYLGLYSRRLASRHGLTGPQLVCVRLLARLGPTTPSVIAREMSLSQATVTGIVDRLDRQGLVHRERDVADRRRVVVALTAQGEEVAKSAPSALQDNFLTRLAALPPGEQRAIHESLERIVEMMDDSVLPSGPPSASLLTEEATLLALGGFEAESRAPAVGDSATAPQEEEA
jgi:DNA-binding MarR family transcriptional regulator